MVLTGDTGTGYVACQFFNADLNTSKLAAPPSELLIAPGVL